MVESCRKQMKTIGGYFSLELPFHEEYHKDAIKLNTGRNCLEFILRARKYQKVFIPYYTCEAILEPFHKLGVGYEFYHINRQFEIEDDIVLNDKESILYTNYFGLKQKYIENLVQRYNTSLIVDNTQAFFADHILGLDTFYTCRKFFGVPDGAYLYCDALLDDFYEQDQSFGRMDHLLKRIDLTAEEGYADFRRIDDGLGQQPIRRMSKLTQRIMLSVDYGAVASKRRDNYNLLHSALGFTNCASFPLGDEEVPMVYPYLSANESLRGHLIKNRIYVALYWPNISQWISADALESNLSIQMIPLPIDQRYGKDDMNYIINVIKSILE